MIHFVQKILPWKYIISAVIDKTDHNDTSNTAVSHFHGTSRTMFQHANNYTELNDIHILDTDNKAKINLDSHLIFQILKK